MLTYKAKNFFSFISHFEKNIALQHSLHLQTEQLGILGSGPPGPVWLSCLKYILSQGNTTSQSG